MKNEALKNFLKVQSCTLILVLALLPEFDLLSMLTGIDFNVAMLICKLICIIGIGLSLYKLCQEKQATQAPLPISYLVTNGGGAALALLSLIPSMPDWFSYLALIALAVSLFLGTKTWEIRWKQLHSQGAYLVLLAVLIHLFHFVNDTMATTLAAFVGLIIYLMGLSKMKQSLDPAGQDAVGKLRIAVFIGIAALVFDLIPLMGWLSIILAVAAFVLEFMGYGKLQTSTLIGIEGANGAGRLRNSMIVMAIAALVGFLSDSVASFITLLALLMAFSGWTQIIMGIETQEQTFNS